MAERKLWKGNEAVAAAAIKAGCNFYAGYPITPQNELMELLSWTLPQNGGVFVQAESEPAAINMIKGASVAGARAMTATSAPGLALMQEGLGSMTVGRVPMVLVDMQRAFDFVTPAQYDYHTATKSLGHSGLRVPVYSASTVQEMMDVTMLAFQKADQYRTPVYLLFDGMLGQMIEHAALPDAAPQLADRSDWIVGNNAGRTPRFIVDTPAGMIKGTAGFDANEEKLRKLDELFKSWEDTEVRYSEYLMEDAEYAVVSYGSSARFAKDAVDALRDEGYKVGLFKAISLNPFPRKQLHGLKERGIKGVVTAEMAIPLQFCDDVKAAIDGQISVLGYSRAGGNTVKVSGIVEHVKRLLG